MESTVITMNTSEKTRIDKIAVEVPVHGPGNIIKHVNVDFDVFKDEKEYIALPLQNISTARLTDLPATINFTVNDDWVTCAQTEHKYVAVDIFNALKKRGKL